MPELTETAPREFTKEQASLLLLFEACAVDHGGRVKPATMSAADHELADAWRAEGFIDYGKIKMAYLPKNASIPDMIPSLWVELSDEAWDEANRLRRERGLRVLANQTFERVRRR